MGLLKPLILSLLLIIAAGAPSQIASAEPSHTAPAAPDTALPTLDPIRIIDLPMRSEWSGIDALAFSPSGKTLFALQPVPAVNLWAAYVVWYWPEIFAVGTTLAGLFFLFMLRRILKRPRTPGLPYCRACNYCLHQCVSPRCPECGVALDTKPPLTGRHWLLRLGPFALVLAIISGTWGRLVFLQTQRVNGASEWFTIPWEIDDRSLEQIMDSGPARPAGGSVYMDDPRLLDLSRIYTVPVARHRVYSFRTEYSLNISGTSLAPICDDRILLRGRGNLARIVSAPTGANIQRTSQPASTKSGISLSPSGSRAVTGGFTVSPAAIVDGQATFRLTDLASALPRAWVSLPANAYLQRMALSDDGKTLAVAATLAPEESWKQEHTLKIYLFDLSSLPGN